MRKATLRITLALCLLYVSGTPIFSIGSTYAQSSPQASLLISELQTGGLVNGVEDGRSEFIELYNPRPSELDLTGWSLNYLSASHTGSGQPTRRLAVLDGTIGPQSYILIGDATLDSADMFFAADNVGPSGLMAKTGGHVSVTDPDQVVVDMATWGTGVTIGEWWKAPEIPAGQSIQRILPGDPAHTTGMAFAAPTPFVTPWGGNVPLPPVPPDTDPEIDACQGIVLSEILPNPAGADAGREFIEIHNTGAGTISLAGCGLRLGATGTIFVLPSMSLPADSYKAFYGIDTNMTLPNALGVTVWLIGSAEEGVTYADGLKDDESWVAINGTWQRTLTPTPGQPNVLTKSDVPPRTSPQSSVPCPSGKERNPMTNRCRNIPSSVAPRPCKPGTVRNPDTGRCRSTTTTTYSTPCKQGQARNPETGRCRSVLATSTSHKPCAPGQERNPETNRCRKVIAKATSMAKVEDIASPASSTGMRWWILGLALMGIAGYAAYEWRRDISNILHRLRHQMAQRPPHGK